MWVAIAAGAGAGLASIPHCVGMCGPLAAFACKSPERKSAVGEYLGGRLLSYSAAGAVVGWVGHGVTDVLPQAWVGTLLSWTLAVALALAAWRLWRGSRPADALVRIQTKSSSDRRLRIAPWAVGVLTVGLPCGALVSGLLIAASTASALHGALSMASFSVASGAGLVAVGWVAKRSNRVPRGWGARALATLLAIGSVFLVVRPMRVGAHGEQCHHEQSQQASGAESHNAGLHP